MRTAWIGLLVVTMAMPVWAGGRKPNPTWTDPAKAAKEDPDFSIQGEYGSEKAGAPWGVQVVALGGGQFDAYLLEGGLPGLGWTREKSRTKRLRARRLSLLKNAATPAPRRSTSSRVGRIVNAHR